MAKTKSSSRWLQRHFDDSYVQKARQAGYRSRAAFKLLEINARDRILRSGLTVVDLGAAPGGWSQVAVEAVGGNGKVVALDILPMDPLAGVTFLQGDFREQSVFDQLLTLVIPGKVDLVMSDMAPNISGVKAVDQPRAMYLAELSMDVARKVLAPGGSLLVKVFQGEGIDDYRTELKRSFSKLTTRKPKSSRPESPEVYLLASGYNL